MTDQFRQDAAWDAVPDLIAAAIADGRVNAGTTFPLAVSANNRHLVTVGGAPFYIVGDSPYGMFVNMAPTDGVTATDLGSWLTTRKAQGFNAVRSVIVSDEQTGGRSDGSTFDGITPFIGTVSGSPDLTTPRATYWARMDTMLQMIADYGFLILLGQMETQGWLDVMVANGTTRCNTYGQFIGDRYAHFDNIIWVSGNDYQDPDDGGANDLAVKAVLDGVRTANPEALQTIQLFFLNSDSFDDGSPAFWRNLIDLNTVYSYNHQYTYFRTAYGRSPTMPAYLIEATYEHEHNSGTDDSTPVLMRSQMYWGLTNGLTGHFYGEHLCWPVAVGSGWEDAMLPAASPIVTSVEKFIDFVATIDWHTLVPDQSNTFLTAGQGTNGNLNYATAAKDSGGTLGVVYIPFSTNVTINLALMAGAVTATWFDPTNGATSSAGSSLSGSHVFTHPGNNAGGSPDWVLILEA